jgi:signal transduction histidine kinase
MPTRPLLRLSLTAHVMVGLVMAGASLFEAAFGGQDAGLSPASVLISAGIGVACVVAWFSPLAGVVVNVLALGLPMLWGPLPLMGGAHLVATMLLVGYAAYRTDRRTGLAAYAGGALVPATTIVVAGQTVWEFLFYALILGPAWVVGFLLRREQERSAELGRLAEALRLEREKQAEVAVAAERTRISRELHDAVAHTVSVMTLQVGVVRRRLDDGTVEEETLRGAESLGRQAVDELRRIVGLVREGEAPALAPLPSLAQIDELVAQVRSAGTEVSLDVRGDLSGVGHAVDMSAYRIVQEALTNALRHAPGAAVDVVVEVAGSAVEVAVGNGPASSAARPERGGGGNGLPGMRERAHVLGGTLEAAPRADGGFAVRAVLPRGAVRAAGIAEVTA